jgi:hypothetical protein
VENGSPGVTPHPSEPRIHPSAASKIGKWAVERAGTLQRPLAGNSDQDRPGGGEYPIGWLNSI